MPTTKVGRRGQITIPKAVRQTLGVAEGDRVAFVDIGGNVVLRPVRQTLRGLRGSVPVEGPQDWGAVRASACAPVESVASAPEVGAPKLDAPQDQAPADDVA